jgi:hypothetical protein
LRPALVADEETMSLGNGLFVLFRRVLRTLAGTSVVLHSE